LNTEMTIANGVCKESLGRCCECENGGCISSILGSSYDCGCGYGHGHNGGLGKYEQGVDGG